MTSAKPRARQVPTESGSRISGFFRMDVETRIGTLGGRTALSDGDVAALESGAHTLKLHAADKMIENVVGVFGLPLGVGLNFLIDGRETVVPLAVEEPSIVAGLSGAARTARFAGGYATEVTDAILIGQVQVLDVKDVAGATEALRRRKADILELANSLHPRMTARGGGARDMEVLHHRAPLGGREGAPVRDMVVVHLLVDTCDAMGANVVNGMCEGIAGLVESITGGKVFLRILSNLTDRALVRARVRIPVAQLAMADYTGEQIRDGIVVANDLALVDPYRAATHNKGIMNGVDAVAIATGNDFRAIEAAAHAYAARSGRYRALTRWRANADGDLEGELEMPMKVGTVGGSLASNPSVRLCHRLLGNPGAAALASVMGAVGLAQNYAALRSLCTAGIQRNHMALHARAVASAAEVPEELFEEVAESLIAGGEVKVWKARQLVAEMTRRPGAAPAASPGVGAAPGKAILLGEHAVVYGRCALAAPVPLQVQTSVTNGSARPEFAIPRWGVERQALPPAGDGCGGAAGILASLVETLGLEGRRMVLEVAPNVPREMGLGGSAALAVSAIRALDRHFGLGLCDEQVNALALDCERVAHGTPSGVDNTVATYGATMLYRGLEGGRADFDPLTPRRPVPLVIGYTGKRSRTSDAVAMVARARRRSPCRYDAVFDQIDGLARAGADAIRAGDLGELGELMNLCHGYLNALQVSNAELEQLVHLARRHGAAGAKLTGGGRGGAVVAVCPDGTERVESAMTEAGYEAFSFELTGGATQAAAAHAAES